MTDILAVAKTGRGFAIAEVDIIMPCSVIITKGQAVALPWSAFTAAAQSAQASVLQLRSGICGIALGDYIAGQSGRFRVQGACQALVASTTSTALTADARLAFFGGRILQLDVSAVDTRRYVAISGDTGALTAAGILKNVVMMGPNGLGISGGSA